MKRFFGYLAVAMCVCALPTASNATLVGDTVSLGHYFPDTAAPTSMFTPTVSTGGSDVSNFYFSYPYGYSVNMEASSVLVDFSYVIVDGETATWGDTTTSCSWGPTGFSCIDVPASFNGLGITGLNDSSGGALQGVSVDTNMAGWNTSMLSFDTDKVFFDWKGLSYDNTTYFNAAFDFSGQVGGAAPVPEPSTLLLIGSGIAGLAAVRKFRKG